MSTGFLVLETGECYRGRFHGGDARAGEVVFNTSHSGYEEIATDPSYFSQIMVMTAPMQGNYGSNKDVWESSQIHLQGFVALEIQDSERDRTWKDRLISTKIPVISEIDTRKVVLRIRQGGTPWGALVEAANENAAKENAYELISKQKKIERDWCYTVSRKNTEFLKGADVRGPRVAIVDFGVKQNIIREISLISSEVGVFSSRASAKAIQDWSPDGILLSNGPGDPADVQVAISTIRDLLGWRPIFGICMGHQLLGLALGGSTKKMPFGHRGGNHPVKDLLQNEIYMTSQNHGYMVDPDSLPSGVQVTHKNLYDGTLEGLSCASKKCMSVQFHPESHPGPRDAQGLFAYFRNQLR